MVSSSCFLWDTLHVRYLLNWIFIFITGTIPELSKGMTSYTTNRGDTWSIKKAYIQMMTSIFPLWPFHLYVTPFQQHLHKNYRAYGSYHDFLAKGLELSRKLLNQGFLVINLKSSFRMFYSLNHNLVKHYGKALSQMTTDVFRLS